LHRWRAASWKLRRLLHFTDERPMKNVSTERLTLTANGVDDIKGDSTQLSGEAAAAVARTCDFLLQNQHEDGYWCAELEGDSILQSEYILLQAWLGKHKSEPAVAAARYLKTQQAKDGSWGQFPGSDIDISASVKAYFALKLTGHDPQAPYMVAARKAIRDAGGADKVNSFTRFYLALLGQISYDHCPAAPPEVMMLPTWSPVNIYQISAWSRTILVPLTIMWAKRPSCEIPAELGIEELFVKPPSQWPPLRCPGAAEDRRWITWENTFRGLDWVLKKCEAWKLRPLRNRGLRLAEEWMLARFEESDGLGAIFPPIVWSAIALRCLGYSDDSKEVVECHRQLDALMIHPPEEASAGASESTLRLQPCKSPVWDTTIALRALAAAGITAEHPASGKAIQWLLSKEVSRGGDWQVNSKGEPGGWFFEHNNRFYPDTDDTAMALLALREQLGEAAITGGGAGQSTPAATAMVLDSRVSGLGQGRQLALATEQIVGACERGRRWMLSMQNNDGGWGAFDRNNDAEFLCRVPFADHNAMIDPSTPDIAARIIESFAAWGMQQGDVAVDRAIGYIRQQQEEDGSWYGRWGINYIYGTWQTLVGLAAVGVPANDPAMTAGAEWLRKHQQPCGGWGETARSYEDPSLRGQGAPTASQTAWALLGLIAAGQPQSAAALRGVRFLLDNQRDDGGWDETEFTGTGFPLVFYLKYHYYPIYFPLLALAQWRKAVEASNLERSGDANAAERSEP